MAAGRRVDVPLLFRLWNTPELTINEVARQLGLTPNQLRRVREKYGLLERPDREEPQEWTPADPTPEEIAERAAAIRAEWPDWRFEGGRSQAVSRYSYDGRQHVFRKMSH